MSFRPLTWITVAVFGLAASAMACLWDNDTLAEESKGKLDLLSTIVGRFERNPPLYYEMRLKRVAAELANHPSRIALYDDAAVACDRLGRGDEAIAWIEKKRAQMPPLEKSDAAMREHWYRYYANAGTFWAHRWFRDGAKKERIKELEYGRDLIKKAIEMNPNAHFGREKYQLLAMEWLLDEGELVDGKRYQHTLESFLDKRAQAAQLDLGVERQQRITALAGLIKLGGAWESLDVFAALHAALTRDHLRVLAHVAHIRIRELRASGRKSAKPGSDGLLADRSAGGVSMSEDLNAFHDKQVADLRRNADLWHERRTEFMLARLRQGKHPDTHADFWAGYREVPPMKVSDPPIWIRPDSQANFFLSLYMLAGVAVLLTLWFVIKRAYRRKWARAR